MFYFLPQKVLSAINCLNFDNLYEIRIRADRPIIINYNNMNCYLGQNGIVKNRENAYHNS